MTDDEAAAVLGALAAAPFPWMQPGARVAFTTVWGRTFVADVRERDADGVRLYWPSSGHTMPWDFHALRQWAGRIRPARPGEADSPRGKDPGSAP